MLEEAVLHGFPVLGLTWHPVCYCLSSSRPFKLTFCPFREGRESENPLKIKRTFLKPLPDDGILKSFHAEFARRSSRGSWQCSLERMG
jgi:hypothetical protein